ncbi:hypothetical protein OTK49_01625 [Vibrio coralliirubri]|uniref:hypothetical protein n=1 Tax=Vibrio coralliirubri TaxID=1516159 RepID=UPI0022844ED8|nr:hypothetical protein [Vibrio coralliirubri]MCY9861224.1 hypothetical protein [Vibrio coralliirubri]
MLDETSVVVENIFVLGLVKNGFTLPAAVMNAFANQRTLISKALGLNAEDCVAGEQDILDLLNESGKNGFLIEFSMPPAKDLCLDESGKLLGCSYDLDLKITDFFYSDTLEGCINKAVDWYNAYIIEQISALD